ncbi:MAG: HAMP domain-containing protein [Cohaesibacteraceae bacterium]|nr:HAMP domain-containing protein [Cohaesibacteraceae bacterium]MBL4875865.1 HAMP domain-containing protein [Cohaesibacteraceae bacterium]
MGDTQKRQWTRSIQFRFLFILLLGAGIIGVLGIYGTYYVSQQNMQEQVHKRGLSLASSINHAAMIAHSDADLQHVISEISRENPDVKTVAIMLNLDQRVYSAIKSNGDPFTKYADQEDWLKMVKTTNTGIFKSFGEFGEDILIVTPLWHTMAQMMQKATNPGSNPGLVENHDSHSNAVMSEESTLPAKIDIGARNKPATTTSRPVINGMDHSKHKMKGMNTEKSTPNKMDHSGHNMPAATPVEPAKSQIDHSKHDMPTTSIPQMAESTMDNDMAGMVHQQSDTDWQNSVLAADQYRGVILIRIDHAGVTNAISNIMWAMTPIGGFGILSLLALTFFLLHKYVMTPLNSIQKVMKAQQNGDLTARAESLTSLEFSQLADTFNEMMNVAEVREIMIKKSEIEIKDHRDHLQDMVNDATRELQNRASELNQSLVREQELGKIQREFVSMASHEFRTPLSIIDQGAQRVISKAGRDKLTNEDVTKRMNRIRGAVKRMTQLMNSTLDSAKLEEGKLDVKIGDCNIGALVKEVCVRQQDVAKNHIILCSLEEMPSTIRADTGSVDQILTNLLSNAVKYAPKSPEIVVSACQFGDFVEITVTDEGLGIPKSEVAKIGERFFRASTSSGIAGTGIGLNLCMTLVEMHDGTMTVESVIGEGSTFTVRLPLDGPKEEADEDSKAA